MTKPKGAALPNIPEFTALTMGQFVPIAHAGNGRMKCCYQRKPGEFCPMTNASAIQEGHQRGWLGQAACPEHMTLVEATP